MSFIGGYGKIIQGNSSSTFSSEEILNYTFKNSLNKLQTDLRKDWYLEPNNYVSKLPSEVYKNNIPSFNEMKDYFLVDPDITGGLGETPIPKVTNITVSQIINQTAINSYKLADILNTELVRNNAAYMNLSDDDFVDGSSQMQIKKLSRTMFSRYSYWKNQLTGKRSLTEGGLETTNTAGLTNHGTYTGESDETTNATDGNYEPFNSMLTYQPDAGGNKLSDSRVWDNIDLKVRQPSGSNEKTFFEKLITYSKPIPIIHPDYRFDEEPMKKIHPFLEIYVQLPLYSSISSNNAINIAQTVNNSSPGTDVSITDNIGFTNPVLQKALGDGNGFPYKIMGYTNTDVWQEQTTAFGAGNTLYFVHNPGFIFIYGIGNIAWNRPLSARFPPLISFMKYNGETLADGIIQQTEGIPEPSIYKEKDLIIDKSENRIYRLDVSGDIKEWVSVGGGNGIEGSNGNIIIQTSGYPYYQTLGPQKIVNPPSSNATINGVNITALNKRTRTSYASANSCVSTWTVRTTQTSNNWNSVCWSPELSLFCAVSSLPNNTIMISRDSITWTSITTSIDNNWYSVCWSPELSLFCAVGDSTIGEPVMTSPDGINWTTRTASGNNWNSVCWSPELSLFCAVGNRGTTETVMTSSDGINWTTRTESDNDLRSVCWSPELSLFCAVGNISSENVMTSPDGINWTTRTALGNNWNSICWSPELSLFCAVRSSVNEESVMTSPDGINWTTRIAPNNDWRSVCWSPELSLFCAVGTGGIGESVMTSFDGINWNTKTTTTNTFWYSICWSPELSIFCSVGFSGTMDNVMTSEIGMPNSKNVVKTLPGQITVDTNGNIGVGTGSSGYKLDVSGNIRTNQSILCNSIVIDGMTYDRNTIKGDTGPAGTDSLLSPYLSFDSDGYVYYVYKNTSGTKSFTVNSDSDIVVDLLVVGGGGGSYVTTSSGFGGTTVSYSGGGGGGGVLVSENITLTKGDFTVIVGSGGNGQSGNSSSFGSYTADGGSVGNLVTNTGGKSGLPTTYPGGNAITYTSTLNNYNLLNNIVNGGGAGAGGAGGNAVKFNDGITVGFQSITYSGASGGNGLRVSKFINYGDNGYFGGGGGGTNYYISGGLGGGYVGGLGGGGNSAQNGDSNTGGGAGIAYAHGTSAGQIGSIYNYSGGSGIVIVRAKYMHYLLNNITSVGHTSIDIEPNSKLYIVINTNLSITGDVKGEQFITTSDDRVKFDEEYIENATETIMKLRPQKYRKTKKLYDNSGGFTESGLIAQEIYYQIPELRHLINIPLDASGIETISSSLQISLTENVDPSIDPDYSNWGSTEAGIKYYGLIPYLVKSNQEQQYLINTITEENINLKIRLEKLENIIHTIQS